MASRGTVKQVLSADTIVVMGQARGGPPPERTLSISGISAPRLARRPGPKDKDSGAESKDEPFAWESREFLRKKLVGKEVEFTVDYKVPTGREFATILVGPAKENLAHLLVQEGFAKPREGGKGPVTAEQTELAAKAATAQAAQKGVYGSPESLAKAVRNVTWNVENLRALVDSAKGKPFDAVIENVRDGCTLRVTLLPAFQNVNVVLSGIKTPTFKRVGEKEEPEPFAEEARFFTEVRLLQRDVKVLLEGVTGQNLLGTVLHPAGNISELLLQQGYARIVDWSFGNVTNGREKMRAAEQSAKTARLRLWADHKVSEKAAIEDRDFAATVEEVVSTDCVVVNYKGRSRKVFLASIRQPRPKEEPAAPAAAGGPAAPRKRLNYWEIPWAFEAREFLRKKLVGQKAQVHIDYVKPGTDGMPERVCATIKMDGINIAEALVSKGYATVVRYREGDDDRAAAYDDLLAAEARAQKSQKGVHSDKDVPVHRINDVNVRAIAEKLLPSLQRAGRISGVVEYVQSGSRLRVYLPKESCIVTLLLAGLSCPRAGSADKPSDPFGDEAQAYMRSQVLQHEVDVELEDIDKNGAFVGNVYLAGTNVAVGLLTDGLSKLHPSVDKYKNTGVLLVAESSAKEARRKLWAGYVEPVAVEAVAEKDQPRNRKFEPSAVTVTELSNATTFWAHAAGSAGSLERIMGTIASYFSVNPPLPGAHTAKRNELLVAKFSADGQWYRAKVLKITSPSDIQVQYVDFGNFETVTSKDVAPLPAGAGGPGLAAEYHIAFLQTPPADWVDEATEVLRERILNKTINVNVEYRDAGVEYVTVHDDSNVDVGQDLVEQGLAQFKGRSAPHLQELLAGYTAAQVAAKKDRRAIWRYGDASEDDTPEFGRRR